MWHCRIDVPLDRLARKSYDCVGIGDWIIPTLNRPIRRVQYPREPGELITWEGSKKIKSSG